MTTTASGFALKPGPASLRILLADAWRSRDLVLALARKDFFVRYRRASLGVLWAVGLPLVQAVVLTVVFSRIGRFPTGTSYAAFVFSGMVAWSYFSATFTTGSTAIVDNAGMANRIYFPRMALPAIGVIANLYSFVVTLIILLGICLGFRVHLGVPVVLMLPATVLMVLLTLAFSLFASALHVYFRDVRFLVQASLIAWFYLTPIFYPIDLKAIDGALKAVLLVNPMTGVVEVFRAATVGADSELGLSVAISCLWVVVLLGVALVLHRRYDRLFTDLL